MSPVRAVDVAGLRLEAQRVSTTHFSRPDETVAWLGAVQAQDYLGALWAVGLRTAGAGEADVEGAIAEGSIVRTWPIRGTLHFVAAADAGWLLALLAPRTVARAAGRLRALGIDGAVIAHARRVLVKRLERDGQLTRPQAYEALESAGVSTEGQRGVHLLWCLAHDRVVCFGPRAGKQPTVVLFDAWVKGGKSLARDEALAELALRYFGSRGPATLLDFAWWSGLSVADARTALHLAGDRMSHTTIAGRPYWYGAASPPAAKAHARARLSPGSRAHLLPAFDEFTVAYADRSAALDARHKLRLNAGGGMLNPVVVVDARIVGTWKRTLARRDVAVAPAFFQPVGSSKASAVAAAVRRYADFLGLGVRDEA
jgi:hypothetical protein